MESSILANENNSWWRFNIIDKSEPNYDLKIAVWLYFFLWIFEGALRKWFLPFLSTPLLLVRDPIVLWLMFQSFRRGIIRFNLYLAGIVLLGIVSFFSAVLLGHGNIFVAFFGARTLLMYFPLIFIIGRVFNYNDVLNIGRILLLISIPMTILIGMQFYTPQSSLVNRGIGGDESGSGFGGAMGYFRPSATFSFANGTANFYSLVGCFIMYFSINPKQINRNLLIIAACSLMIAIPLSIVRGLFFQVGVSVIFLFLAVSRNPSYFGKLLIVLILLILTLTLLSNIEFFNTATEVFTSRFESANEEEGGLAEGVLGDRVLGQLVKSIIAAANQPVFGFGIGSGTALGAQLLNNYDILSMADYEWMRQIGEFGLMGVIVILIRVGLAIKLALLSYFRLTKNEMLPWFIMSLGVLIVSQGPWFTPTALGFFSLIGGLWIASLKKEFLSKHY